MTGNIDQRKYLERYLSGPSKEKKKRKKKNILGTGMKIIDDDIDLSKMIPVDDDEIDLLTTSEDAPQIAGIIDERPLEVKLKEHLAGTKHWQLVSDGNPFDETFKIESKSETNKTKAQNTDDSDCSPERNENRLKIGIKDVRKGTIKKKEEGDNSDHSSSKINGKKEQKKIHKRSRSNSSSEKTLSRKIDKNVSRNKQQSDSDGSPPRRKKYSDLDSSPPRKKRQSDTPPRKTKYVDSNISSERKRRNSDSDASPPRRKPSDKSKTSLPRNRRNSDSDFSPLRKQKHSDSDASPPRKGQKINSNVSPSRKRIKKSYVKEDYDSDNSKSKNVFEKLKQTMDGKKAGLQPAKEQKNEQAALKQREDEIFQKLDPKSLGIGASVIKRDRKTGTVRDLEKEAQKEAVVKEKENIQKEKYTRWGKGLKQVDEINEKIQNDLYEMSKPVARYADDKDLDNYLKNQEREGDPMLAYIKSKKKTDGEGCDDKPKYSGAFLPNRFGISPGYRWDGVDRSNGYEKRWFDVLNNKKALEEEAYKWGTEDM